MLVLGIETSCDDTSMCILESNNNGRPNVLAHDSFTSADILSEWGGVVPEIAARNHMEKLTPLLKHVLKV